MSDVKPKGRAAQEPVRLASIEIINGVLYLNGQAALNYKLPLDNGWKINELADHIMRACAEYDVIGNYESARYLALRVAKAAIKETLAGEFELGWD